jgi:LmbE family N-acetylglucosaminyl deacetylase
MGTLVCFHAHPDDESIQTGGTMALAAAAGNRVVLVVATGGEHGETPDDLGPGETLADRRRVETDRSAVELGIHRVVFLGYEDSGMTGWDQNGHHASFHQAPLDEAAQRLAAILRRSRPTRSPATTGTVVTVILTTSRCTTSGTAPPSSPARRTCTKAR